MEPCSSLQKYLRFLLKKCNILSPQININSYQSQSLSIMKNLLQLAFCFELCQILRPKLETFHTPMIKITYTSTHMLYFYHWKIAIISIHLQKKTPSSIMSLSPRLSSRIWAIQKEIKDAYPKKVCHMPKRYEKKESAKKREKMHTQRRYATCPQDMSKKMKKKIYIYSPCPRKKIQRER